MDDQQDTAGNGEETQTADPPDGAVAEPARQEPGADADQIPLDRIVSPIAWVELDHPTQPTRLDVRLNPGLRHQLPDEIAGLIMKIEHLERDIAILFKADSESNDRERWRYLRELAEVARKGLEGLVPQVALATAGLEAIKREILVRESRSFKTKYMAKLGKRAGVVGLAALSVAGCASLLIALGKTSTPPSQALQIIHEIFKLSLIRDFALLIAGCAAGVWLSYSGRQPALQFDELVRPDQNSLGPWSRLLFAELFTIVLAMMFALKIVSVTFGDISTGDVLRLPMLALVIGALCGLSEQALSTRVAAQASRLLGSGKAERPAGAP